MYQPTNLLKGKGCVPIRQDLERERKRYHEQINRKTRSTEHAHYITNNNNNS